MKSIVILITALTLSLLTCVYAQAQETQAQSPIEKLSGEKEKIIQEEKEALKTEVEFINTRVDKKEITKEEAEILKTEVAEKHALNIENRLAIIDNQIALQERNGIAGETKDGFTISISTGKDDNNVIYIGPKNKKRKYDRRTTSGLNLAFGLNNVITEGESFNDSDFEIGGSRFFEIGWSWKTRVFEDSNWLRFKYGVAFQFNGLKPTGNRYYVVTGEQTELQPHPFNLDKSKFRMDNLVMPFHFEFGPSEKIEHEDYFRYKTDRKFRLGLGGYAGVNLGVRQKLKYNEDGDKTKDKLKGDYNSNNLIYGLSGYIGWGTTSVYAKYDLNPIFKNNPVDQRNISLGLRFDFE